MSNTTQTSAEKKPDNPIAKYVRQEHIMNGLTRRLTEAKANINVSVFVTNLLDVVRHSPDLIKAEPESVVAICLAVTMMGLKFDKNLGQAFIIPFKKTEDKDRDNYRITPQLQIGWKGYKALAIQSEQYKRIGVTEVYEFDDEEAVQARLFSLVPPRKGNINQIIGYVAAYELKSGYQESHFMTISELECHQKNFSKGNPVWNNHRHAMRKKTVLKYLLKSGAPLGGLANQIYVNQAISLDGHGAMLDSFDNKDSTGVIVDNSYANNEDGNVYEHVAEQQTQTQHGNVPRMKLSEEGMKKLESAIHAGSISYDEIFYRYDLTEEQTHRVNVNGLFQ